MEEQQYQLQHIVQILETVYGIPLPTDSNPLDELIGTILSQSTSNVNSHRAFTNLKARFASWEAVRSADPLEIAEAIKSGGLANVKSVVIKNILNEIKNRCGTLSLSFLQNASIPEAINFLTSLKGVGPKTARCILLFSCHLNVFPMDTHILRIFRRLEFLPRRCSDARAHDLIEPLVPNEKHLSLHINLIHHGRQVCHPSNPQCERCCLIEYCAYA